MVISHNLSAMNAQRQYSLVTGTRKKTSEKLASGYRINRAADDAAGLSISEKMRKQIRGLDQGAENIQDGVSLLQVADGALSEIHAMLDRMVELSVKAANGTNSESDRQAIQDEIREITTEIDRIGSTTKFNEERVFFIPDAEVYDGSITQLITSPGADSGYLTEAYYKNGIYYPSASLDFSNVTKKNIVALNGGGFSFTCSVACAETFDIKFYTDGTPSSVEGQNSGRNPHYYKIDISKCASGTDVVNTIYDYIKNHMPNGTSPDPNGDLKVAHSNSLSKNGSSIIIYDNTHSSSTADAAKRYHPHTPGSKYGAVDYTSIYYEEDVPENWKEYNIQCSSEIKDNILIHTPEVNREILGLHKLDLSSIDGARTGIDIVNSANKMVSGWRSRIGAEQNRLEHSYANNRNVSENTQAAESLIRDADMAKEMVAHSIQNILSQAGESMMSQANQQPQGVLSLLG